MNSSSGTRFRPGGVLVRGLLALVALGSGPLQAGLVESGEDDGPGSLRQAVLQAAPGETITFASYLSGTTIHLTSGQLEITRDLVIDASNLPEPVTLDASQAPNPQRVLAVMSGAAVVLDSLAITGGQTKGPARTPVKGSGGGIYNAGQLTIRNSTIYGNTTASGSKDSEEGKPAGSGGGIYNSGIMLLEGSTVTQNTTGVGGTGLPYFYTESDSGGGGWDFDIRLVVAYGGSGGPGAGIYNDGDLVVRDSHISGNTTGTGGDYDPDGFDLDIAIGGPSGAGGAIYNAGTLELEGSTINHNLTGPGGGHIEGDFGLPGGGGSGGGIFHAGESLKIRTSRIVHNATGSTGGSGASGGGVHAQGGRVTLQHSTVSDNRTGQGSGGGIYLDDCRGELEGVTIAGNATGDTGDGGAYGGNGAGLFVSECRIEIRTCTIAENTTGYGTVRGGSAAGLYVDGGLVVVENSTVSRNRTGDGGEHPGGVGGVYHSSGILTLRNSIVAGNESLEGEPNLESGPAILILEGENLLEGDPLLGSLGFHGGFTETMLPRPGSPAIDAGVTLFSTPLTDQRGLPRIVAGALDLGAAESGNPYGYEAWAAVEFGTGADSSFEGDANRDGLSNGLSYGCGADVHPIVTFSGSAARIRFGYRPEAEVDLTWRLLRSSDLQTFTEILRIENGVPVVGDGDQLTFEDGAVLFLDNHPPAGSAYYRLQVDLMR